MMWSGRKERQVWLVPAKRADDEGRWRSLINTPVFGLEISIHDQININYCPL
jgi:hypothetical protein